MRLLAWNINGYNDVVAQNLSNVIKTCGPDVVFLSETKRPEATLAAELSKFDGYTPVINSHVPYRYHGVAMLIKKELKFDLLDINLPIPPRKDTNGKASTGRLIAIETSDLIIVGTYTPNSGVGDLKNLDYRISSWDIAVFNLLQEYRQRKETVFLGDINVAPEEIDVSHPEKMKRYAGFTTEERNSLKQFLASGWTDIWRRRNPLRREYSWIGRCSNNTDYGMRLDSFLITPGLIDKCKSAYMLPQVKGSDHIPIGLDL